MEETDLSSPLSTLLPRLQRAFGYLWASPNTLFGLFVGWILRGRFQWVDGVIEIDGPSIAGCLRRMPIPATAMTMGHVVFGQNQECLDRTRDHERVHVCQYARWGPFFLPAYLGMSAILLLMRRDAYRDNPFEIEAYAIDDPSLNAMTKAEVTRSKDASPSSESNRLKQLLRAALPVLLLIGCWAAFQFGREEILNLRERLGPVAPVVTVPVHAIIAAAPVPSDVIVIANGALYPYALAVFLGWLGWFLGSTIEFFAIRLLTGVQSAEDAKTKMPKWLARMPAGSPWFLILGRQIPGVGAHLTVAVAAAAGVSFARYAFFTAIAILPGALLLSAIGAKWL